MTRRGTLAANRPPIKPFRSTRARASAQKFQIPRNNRKLPEQCDWEHRSAQSTLSGQPQYVITRCRLSQATSERPRGKGSGVPWRPGPGPRGVAGYQMAASPFSDWQSAPSSHTDATTRPQDVVCLLLVRLSHLLSPKDVAESPRRMQHLGSVLGRCLLRVACEFGFVDR